MVRDRIVAVGLLTQADVEVLGSSFARLWPVDKTPCFSQLLQAIDQADQQVWRERDEAARQIAASPPQARRGPDRP